jgi:hypothetical protein
MDKRKKDKGPPEPPERLSRPEAEAVLDAWMAEQNKIAGHNLKTYTVELLAHAQAAGRDVGATGLEDVRQQRARDANSGRRQRASGATSPGRRGKYGRVLRDEEGRAVERVGAAPATLREAVLTMHKNPRYARWSWSAVCLHVGRTHGYASGWSAKQASRDDKW